MSQPIDDGGSAFPAEVYLTQRDTIATKCPGMTLRDWLAGQEKVDTNEEFSWVLCEALVGPRPPESYQSNPLEWFAWENKWRAAVRYARADAMLAQRRLTERK